GDLRARGPAAGLPPARADARVSLRTALVLLLPDPRLEELRARFDPEGTAAGIHLHITLLIPFGAHEDGVEELFARWSPLRFSLARVEEFPGAVWLAPEPDDELRERILELYARYPGYPPYGGEVPEATRPATVVAGDVAARAQVLAGSWFSV